jgi:O-acetyl-ADP-ribose deacetylase (regulator of RNase III)
MSEILVSQSYPSGQKLEIARGDLTTEQVDAIVNAANAHLMHGGGVAAAISRRGGPAIQQESDAWVRTHGAVPHHQPAYTSGGKLPCRYVIHAVGPVWGSGDEDRKLHQAILGSLQRADELKLTSIAFPAISTGIFGFPKERAAAIFFNVIDDFFRQQPTSTVKWVRITLYDAPTLQAFLDGFEAWRSQNQAEGT